MTKSDGSSVVPVGRIENAILFIRGHKVMLDDDLAKLYGVSAKRLNEAVRRNRDRFPDDFMFQLTEEEFTGLRHQIGNANLRSQIATSSWGGRRYRPHAFTEQGVAMLSSVLHSKRAVQVNIEIMRTFVRLRQLLASNEELARRLDAIENKYDQQFKVVFDVIRELMTPPATKRRRIGFLVSETATKYGIR
ncbi:MAG TPA: ORF6N domain-containing protein [Candidatus Binatia bacterium]|nr:ORF6N domain-containing protein [Candidatus Binatia bacterium]